MQSDHDNEKAFLAQHTQLNERARWYSTRLWQVPFAYLAIAGVTAGTLLDKLDHRGTGTIFLILFLFGLATIMHMIGMAIGEYRTVTKLRSVEKKLQLDQSKYTFLQSFFNWFFLFTTVLALTIATLWMAGGN